MSTFHDYNKARIIIDDCRDFITAAANGDTLRLIEMLDQGIAPDTIGPQGYTALRKAASRNECEIAFELLKRGAHVDAANHMGQTALMTACVFGHHEMVSLLLLYGADPNIKNCNDRTALMIAASGGQLLVVGALLDARFIIDFHKTDRSGKTALDLATEQGHNNVVKLLSIAQTKSNSFKHRTLHQENSLPAVFQGGWYEN